MCNYRKGSFVDLKVVVEIGVVPVGGCGKRNFRRRRRTSHYTFFYLWLMLCARCRQTLSKCKKAYVDMWSILVSEVG